jgi:TPP-dependent pyruvate/acetoin dehydrogenase alpha subunit
VNITKIYEQMYLIRKFEERLLELFNEAKLFGTTHTYIGQEAIAVSVMSQLTNEDVVFTNHRCHGHYLAYSDDPQGLLAEIMGKAGGICGGRGGSQHLCNGNFFSHGVQGGYMSIVVGMALAEKKKVNESIVVAFIGDGSLGAGNFYEALNMASLWDLPLLIVIENNRYAQTTPIELNLAGEIVDRPSAFGLNCGEIESNDIEDLYPRFQSIVSGVRQNRKCHVEVVHTYRLKAHSKGDDFRDIDEISAWEKKDPLFFIERKIDGDIKVGIQLKVDERLRQIVNTVESMPFANLNEK